MSSIRDYNNLDEQQVRTSRSYTLQPIIVKFPITSQAQQIIIPKIQQGQIIRTMRKLGAIERSIPKQFIFKAFILFLVALVLFYFFLIAIAIMLFNIVLALVSLILIGNYLKWAFLSLRNLRHQVNMRKAKKFLEEENRRYYSSKLIRFQLIEHQNCIKILNLRFSE